MNTFTITKESGSVVSCVREIPENPQGIESIKHSDLSGQKVLRNGQIIIRRNGEEYNIIGIKVKGER